MKNAHRGLIIRILSAALCVSAFQGYAENSSPQARNGDMVQFGFEQADIRLVTQLVGKLTGRKFIIPDNIQGKVTIVTPGQVAREEVWPIYLTMLESIGYTVAEQNGVVRLVALPSGDGVGRVVMEPDAITGLMTKVIPVKHISATDLKKSLEGLVRGGREGRLEAFAQGNHLIVTDTAQNVARLEAVIQELDQPGAGNVIEIVQLTHASAEEVASQLRATMGATDSAVNKVNRHMNQVAGGTGALPTDFTVVAAPHANSVILVGMPLQLAETKRIIALMDVENVQGFGRLNAIDLKYLKAEDMAKSLNSLLGKSADESSGRRMIAIEPSVANNALLVDASPQDFKYVNDLIARLDVVPQQVLVEVLIVEVNLEEGLDLGVEWFLIDQPDGSGTGGFTRSRNSDTDPIMGLLTEGSFPQGLAAGIISGTFTGPDGTVYNKIPFYLRAVAGNRDLKILSNIPLWAQNNMEASVSVVENIPILKSAVEGSGSDRDYIQNIERIDVGIKLKLTPRVNPNNEIQLDLNPSIESVVEDGSSTLSYTPTIAKRETQTTVTVPDRSTVIISGLIREDTTKITTKIPFLGDIPLLGALFRSTSDSKKRTNLLIFVTPTIVTDTAAAREERERLQRTAELRGVENELEQKGIEAEKAAQEKELKEQQKQAEKAAKQAAKEARKKQAQERRLRKLQGR